jgi:hypothetical protein
MGICTWPTPVCCGGRGLKAREFGIIPCSLVVSITTAGKAQKCRLDAWLALASHAPDTITQGLDEAMHDQLHPPVPLAGEQRPQAFTDHIITPDWMAARAPDNKWANDIDAFAAAEFGLLSNLPQPALVDSCQQDRLV